MTLSRSTESKSVAIVGIGCRFPGGVTDPETLWRLLSDGGNAITEIPPDRIDREHYFDPRPAQPGRIMTKWGGFLDRIEEFDSAFFGISPREAERLDPQQRLLCETAWEALEDAGQDAERLAGSRTGVFVGQWLSDFEGRLFADPAAVDFYMTLGSGRYASSGRLSYVLDLHGPSVTLDTACSSSLAAVHLASKSVRDGESELALAGGANVILQPHITIAYSQSRMMAPDGRCKFGDASADGYVRSEGAAIVVLKALERALADGDRVYAVIRGSAINNDGRSSGSMGTVSRTGQEELLRAAYRDAGVPPSRVRYVEAHGTGTQAGDPVELGALGAVLSHGRAPQHRAYVGSVKTNLGHTEGAAGVAGLIKTALSLHRGRIPASLHCRNPSPKVAWATLPFVIPDATVAWPDGEGTRIAGVSAFGIAGSNAHVVLEECVEAAPRDATVRARTTALLPLSAKSREALIELAARYAVDLEQGPNCSVHDLCWNAATRRTALDCRAVFVAEGGANLAASLRRFAAGEPASAESEVRAERPSKIVFVLPGQGAQWVGMGRQLVEREPVFRAAIERCDRAARGWAEFRIEEQLCAEPGSPGYRLGDIDVIQPVLVAMAIAYAELWKSFGVEPDAVIGHSMGEVAAAYLAGVIDLPRAMQIICRRSALMRRAAGRGAMALVELPMNEAQARIEGVADRVSVAGNNSPRASVISGDPVAVKQVLADLERSGVFCRLVKVDVASHSPQMEPLAAELTAELSGLVPSAARIPIYSTVFGRRADGREFDAAYWGKNLRHTVLFGGTVQELVADGATVFIELGPHPVLLPSIQQTAQATNHEVTTLVCGRRDENEVTSMLAAFGGVWAAGCRVDFKKLMPEGGHHVTLPLYAWQKSRHWVPAAELVRPGSQSHARDIRPSDEALGWLYQFRWEPSALAEALEAKMTGAGSWLVLADDAVAGKDLVNALTALGGDAEAATIEELERAVARQREKPLPTRGVVVLAPDDPNASYLPIRALQAMTQAAWRSHPRLWFVTRGGQAVTPHTRVAVELGALWGAARGIAEEHPDVWGGLVDLDPAAPSGSDAPSLAVHLVSPAGEDQVAWRGGQRFVLRIASFERRRPSTPFAWRADAAYLITGGLGDVGLHVARAIAQRGARRLILLGRTPLPPRDAWGRLDPNTAIGRRVKGVLDVEALGVTVHLAAVDVGNEAELRAFLDRYAAEAWPPIRGVIHAAGTVDSSLAVNMDRVQFDAVLRSKLRAAVLLDRLLPDVEMFVTFSSITAYLGLAGAANYAAANAGLDALVHDRAARGLPALSIGWGVWENTGFGKGAITSEYERRGIRGFSAEDATQLFAWLCGGGATSLAVLPIDWVVFRRARMDRGLPVHGDLLALGSSGSESDAPELRGRLADANPIERRVLLENVVKSSVAKVLKIAPAKLDTRRALGSLGLGSLMALELRNLLEGALGRPLSATLAFNYPTVTALVEHLAGDASGVTDPIRIAPEPPKDEFASFVPPNQIAALSDEEATLALRGGRARGVT